MGFFIKLLFVAGFAVTPVYLLNVLVMPALDDLANTYSHLDETAQNIATSP